VIWVKLLAGCLLAELPLEAGNPAAGVEDLLLAGVERVAVRADLGVDVPLRAVDRVVKVFPHEQVTVVTT
jgi:hypothetical protein